MKYYLIHGVDETRKQFMQNQFDKFGISNVTWILSPNKNELDLDFIKSVCSNPQMSLGQISCTYKHYLALQDICKNNYEYAVIMEDNIEFLNNVPNKVDSYLKQLPNDWSCLFDGDICGYKYTEQQIVPNQNVYKKSNEYSYDFQGPWQGSTRGANFILLNLATAKLLYNNFLPFSNVVDFFYNDLFRKYDLNIYWAEPNNVHKIERPSTAN